MRFLPQGYSSLQLDIVGFLAILGESSVLVQSQVAALSKFFLLPRLLPAPQALIRTSRPERLESTRGTVVGAHSGSCRQYVSHLAHLLHNGSNVPAYSIRCERITKRTDEPIPKTIERFPWMKANTSGPKAGHEPKARPFGPVSALSILGSVMSIALFTLAIVRDDGFALVAILALSFLSTIIGVGNRWFLKLKKRTQKRKVPPSDVVIYYPNGALLIVKCTEEIARELYWHPEECDYMVGPLMYRILSLSGTLILMFGVICLGNATLELQLGFAASYIILNAAYWVAAALPAQWNWDLSNYKIDKITIGDGGHNDTFTGVLFKAISITQTAQWARIGDIAPKSKGWDDWLRDAETIAKCGETLWDEKEDVIKPFPEWNYDAALSKCLDPDQDSSKFV
ncbi:MAG: hypothetical protein LQ350_003208 [Teloschistes chrysophthalmus]|nr:MAG: hypothetical protein LQ350_003208 [Niorma chrysophthalma]